MAKRAFDICVSLVGLLLAGPLLLALGLWIKLDSPGPVFFRGVRVGRFGKTFRIFKFRSMVIGAEGLGPSSTTDEDARVTRAGKFIRRFKLDELPQLLNVLAGHMSLVGPRPQVEWAVEQYSQEERQVLRLRPGITDWASIWNVDEGAVLAGAEDPDKAYMELIHPTKMRLQLRYLHEMSLWTDVKLIAYTGLRIFCKGWIPREIADCARPQRPLKRSD